MMPSRTPPKPFTRKEKVQKAARMQLMKERQDACPHAKVDQVLTKEGWRCSDCGKLMGREITLITDTSDPNISKINKWELG